MEISEAVRGLFRQPIIVVDGKSLNRPPWSSVARPAAALIDRMGVRSAVAQGLRMPNGHPSPVTSVSHLHGSDHRLYLVAQPDDDGRTPVLVGLLKVGTKNLFHWDVHGTMRELRSQFCVLDFYVHEEWQRRGIGKLLFESMLSTEAKAPEQIAYDRPSPKLLGFLSKHYGLTDYVPQQNKVRRRPATELGTSPGAPPLCPAPPLLHARPPYARAFALTAPRRACSTSCSTLSSPSNSHRPPRLTTPSPRARSPLATRPADGCAESASPSWVELLSPGRVQLCQAVGVRTQRSTRRGAVRRASAARAPPPAVAIMIITR